MAPTRFENAARYWRSPLVPDGEMVTAQYYDQSFSPHWHDAYTVPVIEAGAEQYRYRGSTFVAETGSLPVINPGEVHTGSRAVETGWRYRVFYLPVDFVQTLADDLAGSAQPMPWFSTEIVRDADLTERVRSAHRLMETGDDALAAETALLDAVSTLLVRHAGQRPPVARMASDAARVERMKARLVDDLTQPLSLADLARSVGLSTFHAARLFTREVGIAPHAWRNQMRLSRALGALRAGRPATEVAAASGFTDQSHFNRHFKKAFGVSPGRWREPQ